MNKRGLLGMIVTIIIILIVGLFWFVKMYNNEVVKECEVDADCVPDSCCHAASCTALKEAPNCEGTFCTADCRPETLDCGQGSCKCIEGKCSAIFE